MTDRVSTRIDYYFCSNPGYNPKQGLSYYLFHGGNHKKERKQESVEGGNDGSRKKKLTYVESPE
jgi:hypothetical protein